MKYRGGMRGEWTLIKHNISFVSKTKGQQRIGNNRFLPATTEAD